MQDIDLKGARLDPTAVFPTPEAVVEHPGLTHEQKIDILERWKYDACELEAAEEEGMGGGGPSMLAPVLEALAGLRVEPHLEPAPSARPGRG